MTEKGGKTDLSKYTSIQRISKIPVVESGYNYVTGIYTRVKNSNRLFKWSLVNVEGGIQVALDITVPTVLLLDTPLTVMDSLICRGLDTVAIVVPAINYPPEQLVSMSKEYVNTTLINPVLKRADSVKQLGLSEANRVGEMAASRLDNALDIADKYVDRYLPDASDSTAENKMIEESEKVESKASHAIHHMNRLGKKLQRRFTKRTLMEAKAIKQGSQDVAQALIYLADLLLRDPKGFRSKMADIWNKLSEDEPENQVPPANLGQLVALLTRESARRFVHITNFIVSTLPTQFAHYFRFSLHHVQLYTNYFLKVVHLEGAKGLVFSTSAQRLTQLRSLILHILETLGSKIRATKGINETTRLNSIGSSETNPDSPTTQSQNNQPMTSTPLSQPLSSDKTQKSGKKNKAKSSLIKNPDLSPSKGSVSSTDPTFSTLSSDFDDSSESSTLETSVLVNTTVTTLEK